MGQHSRTVIGAALLALVVSTHTLTGQLRKQKLVYTLTFSGEIISTPTTAKVTSRTPTTFKVDDPTTLDLTAFVSSHFPAGEGLNCFAPLKPAITAKEGFVEASVEVHDPKIPGDPSQAVVDISFVGRDTQKTIAVLYHLKLRGTRTCTKLPQLSRQTCTIDLIGWHVEGFFGAQGVVGGVLPGQGCVSTRYAPLRLSSQVTLTAR